MTSESINTPRENREQPPSEKRHTYEKEPKTESGPPRSAPKRNPPPNDPDSPNNSQNQGTPWWRIAWRTLQALAAIAVIIYTTLTYFMWQDAHRNFRIDERAWIKVASNVMDQKDIKEGSPIRATVFMNDTGKSFARHVISQFAIVIVPNTNPVPLDYTIPRTVQDAGILQPNDVSAVVVPKTDSQGQAQSLTKEQVADLLNGRSYIAVYGQGAYQDIFGETHWFQHCGWHAYYEGGNSNAIGCTDYNNAGDGQPPK